MPKYYAAILAGGAGIRLGHDTPKQFLPLGDKPVLAWSIEAFTRVERINGIIIVTPASHREHAHGVIHAMNPRVPVTTITGGETRQGSSYNALMSMPFESDDILIFHDAARPFVSIETISSCIREAELCGAAAVYVRAVDTIAEGGEGFVESIPMREKLYYTQTPQAFKYGIIKEAHDKARAQKISGTTDDVKLVLDTGYRVKIVEGDYRNIKITTAFDYEIAQYMAGK